jgi:hypothetical protein
MQTGQLYKNTWISQNKYSPYIFVLVKPIVNAEIVKNVDTWEHPAKVTIV